jgi:hypothetical protein
LRFDTMPSGPILQAWRRRLEQADYALEDPGWGLPRDLPHRRHHRIEFLAQTTTIWAGSNGHTSLYAGMAPHHPRPDLVARRLPPTVLKNVTFAPTRTTPT